MDDAPSFSIGITQIMSSNNNRVFDHEDVGWAENRSKKLHDPLIMAKVSIEKVRKDVPSSSKSKVEKPPKKRGRKVSSPISRPNLPKSVKYKIKQIPAHSLRFGSTYNIGFAEELKLSIGIEGVEKFKNTIFGPYLNIPNCNYQGQITKCLLLLELEQDNIDELHIRHLGDANIPIHHFYMVEDGRYQQYPWGQIVFSKLIKSLRQEFTKEKKMYRLAGMSYVLNVWIYECASTTGDEITVKVGSFIPRICNWRVVGVKPKFDMFMSNIFSQFLRRSRRASTTSSTPPPKKRKNAHPVKLDVIGVNQPEQSVVQSNKNSPILVSGVNVPDAHVPSLDPKEPTDRSGIKQVKKYLKKYNISGTSTSLTMPEFNQEDHVVRPPTTNQLFDKWSSPIAMDLPDNDRFELDVVEDQEQNLIPEPKIVEEDVPVRCSKTFHHVMLDEHDADKVKDNVIKSDKSGSINSDSVSAGTQEAVDTLYGIHSPMGAQPLQVVTPQQLTDTHDLRSGNMLPMDTNVNEIVVHEVSKTLIQRLRLPSKIFQSPYVTIFGSSDKGKEKVDSELHIRPNHLFQDCGIIFRPPSALLDQ
ncbi:hypothetical protein MTR67_024182 [Solanum verrucosum]|uniref:Ulp1 protease family, C-terminal catalytic domain containing protein n=1 Tax=Solanum verrucosum TaxID=315347 RepID=A0AAF0QYC3_SOLVR|nr:hypothetical protein MTR67_024182 [Solanum verrucosum]